MCKPCKHACLVREAVTHLRIKHRHLTTQQRATINKAVGRLPGLFETQESLEFFRLPLEPVPVVPELEGPFYDGLKCASCEYIVRTRRSMQQHCREVHGWQNTRGRGGNVKQKAPISSEPWRTAVPCQRFFLSRRGSGWFEVTIPGIPLPGSPGSPPSHQAPQAPEETFVTEVIRDFHQAQRHTTTIQDNEGKAEPNPWLRRVGWAEHFEGEEPEFIYSSVSLEVTAGWGDGDHTTDHLLLGRAWESLQRVVLAAQEVCDHTTVGLQVLFEVGRKTIHQKPNAPFSARLEPRTMDRYINVWKRVIGYVFRTQGLDDYDRPGYEFTPEQEKALARFQRRLSHTTGATGQEELSTGLDRACVDFLVTLLDHQLPNSSYDSVLLSALAAMGIRQDGGWLPPDDYTPYYSAVIKVARMLVVWQSQLEAGDSYDQLSLFVIVRQKVHRFMTVVHESGQPGPMDWIFDARTYGIKVKFTTAIAGQVAWDGNKITFQKVTFSVDALTEMLHQVIGELGRTMDELCYRSYSSEWPIVELSGLYDDAGNGSVGFSFVTDPRNTALVGLESWLLRRVMATPVLKMKWTTAQAQGYQFRPKVIDRYLHRVDDFRELLLAAIYLLGGQPPRTTELLGLRFINTPYGGIRNIFIQHRMLCMLFTYHKGYQLKGQSKVIYRYLPQALGELLVRYITTVIPFCQQIQVKQSSRPQFSPFLWERSVVRHPSESTTAEDDSKTQLWSSDKMRWVIQDLAVRHMGTPLNISVWRHIIISIGRRYLNGVLGGAASDSLSYDDNSDEDEAVADSILDSQAGHTSHVAGMVYGREIQQGNLGTAQQQENYRKASVLWHQFLGFGTQQKSYSEKPKLELFESERKAVRQKRLDRLLRVDLHASLRQVLRDKDATFRGKQKEALDAVIRGHTPIIQITGTGGGKSMTFLLPVYGSEDGTTVVVVPFLALQEDLQARCRTMGILCDIWSIQEVSTTRVVLVTPESFVTKSFGDFLNRLNVRFQLDRVVLDECHTLLDSSYDFRPQLRSIGSVLSATGAQLVFLTATMPPRDEAEFWTTLGLSPERACIIRELTVRRNIVYNVVQTSSVEEEIEGALGIVRDATAAQYRVIVYCQSVDRAEKVAGELGYGVYHSKAGSTEEKRAVVRQWMANGGAIVATCALGAGIDILDVRLVVHCGRPRSLRDFVQESGRGGRDGETALSVVYAAECRTTQEGSSYQATAREAEDIREYLQRSISCRRTILSRVMDGRLDRTGCEEGELACDLCNEAEELEDGTEATATEEQEGIIEDSLYITASAVEKARVQMRLFQHFLRCLRFYRENCIICLSGGMSYEGHRFMDPDCGCCHMKEAPQMVTITQYVQEIRRLLRQRRLKSFSGCYFCGVPQRYCERWEETEQGFQQVPGVACTFEEVMYLVIALALAADGGLEGSEGPIVNLARESMRELGLWAPDSDGWRELMLKPVVWAGIQTNGLCILFYLSGRESVE